MACSAVVVAAGMGKRMRTEISKQFLKLRDKEILVHTLLKFENCEGIFEIVVVTGKDDISLVKGLIADYGIQKAVTVVAGGKERQDSVRQGINCVSETADLIAVHDGARPFVRNEDILNTIKAAASFGGAAIGVPVKDTLKTSGVKGLITGTVDRSCLWAIQTPQIFSKAILLKAFEAAEVQGFVGTDECMLVERIGLPVALTVGHYDNIKITTKEDLYMGEAILKNQEEANR